jgi:hypothetical protein
MYVYICVCKYIYRYICIYICVYTYVYTVYIYIYIQMIVRALFLVNPILLGLPLGLPHQQKGYPGLLHDLTKNTKRDVMEFQFCFGIIQNIAMSM